VKCRPLPREFFERPTTAVARALIGTFLESTLGGRRCVGRVVETEAYLSRGDEASHSRSGPTARNRSMFLAAGHAYVYFTYGMHHCFNVVTGPEGVGEAVLVRALEPVLGADVMRARRGRDAERDLCSGPAKLVQALAIERAHDGHSLASRPLRLLTRDSFAESFGAQRRLAVDAGARIGIRRSTELPLRFCLRGSRFVSR